MPYDKLLEQRIRRFLNARRVPFEPKKMMGGLCFMVNGKMYVGVEKHRLMARIGPGSYDEALTRPGCHPMDFTGRPLRGFVFVEHEGLKSDDDLAFWLELALAYNPIAKSSKPKRLSAAKKSSCSCPRLISEGQLTAQIGSEGKEPPPQIFLRR